MSDCASELIRITNGLGRGVVPSLQHHECFTAGAFDVLLAKARGAKAFELLGELCKRSAEVEAQPAARAAYFALLEDLARQSGTTAVPPGLAVVLAGHPEHGSALRAWYRLAI